MHRIPPPAPGRPISERRSAPRRLVRNRIWERSQSGVGDQSAGTTLLTVARQHVRSGSPFEEPFGYTRAVRMGDTIVVGGTAPIWPDGDVDPDPTVQARRCWEIALGALE